MDLIISDFLNFRIVKGLMEYNSEQKPETKVINLTESSQRKETATTPIILFPRLNKSNLPLSRSFLSSLRCREIHLGSESPVYH